MSEKIDTTQYTRDELIQKIRKDSEELFASGTFFCSEAVVTASLLVILSSGIRAAC